MPPSNFRVIDTTSTSVTFQWDALSDQQANGVVQQYVITCTERYTNTKVNKIERIFVTGLTKISHVSAKITDFFLFALS